MVALKTATKPHGFIKKKRYSKQQQLLHIKTRDDGGPAAAEAAGTESQRKHSLTRKLN